MDNKKYFKLTGNTIDNRIPPTYIPKLELGDYNAGNVKRYFLQEAGNDTAPIFEVSQQTFGADLPYYKRVELEWRIIGDLEDKWDKGTYYPSVITSNRKAINTAAKTMPAIRYYLVNLKQFWKPL
jgi:hypothetical protein